MTTLYDFSYHPTLDIGRFHLRRITYNDVDAYIEMFSDPEVSRYLIVEPLPTTRQQAIDMIDWINGFYEQRAGVRWAITVPDSPAPDKLIGTCGFHIWEQAHRRCDIGYELNSAYWGRGYMTEIVHGLVRWCFENLDLHRVQADCTDGNLGSQRVLEKVGFTLEGIWRENCFEHGRFVSLRQYGLLRREYLGA